MSPPDPQLARDFQGVSASGSRASASQRAPTPGRAGGADASTDADLASVRRFARWLDVVPIDPVLGLLLPGVGDVLGSVFGLYIVGIAVRRKLPLVIIARMLLNLAADALIGAVPLLGDLGDLAFKANRKNADLLVSRADHARATWRDWAVVVGAGLALAGAIALSVWLSVLLVRWIF